eukprot:12476422-Ditylum_brightwellii.AAC.1
METPEHVAQCPKANNLWTTMKSILCDWGQKNRAKPDLTATLLSGIDLWRNQEESTEPITRDKELKQVFALQNKIGWDCALKGILSTKWKEIQESYLKSIVLRNQGRDSLPR